MTAARGRRESQGDRRTGPPAGRRLVPVTAVVVALAGLVAAGAVVRPASGSGRFDESRPTLVPIADMSATEASVWNCPGPLPLGGGFSSSIAISNPGPREATATVLIAETAIAHHASQGPPLARRTLTVRLPPGSDRTIGLLAARLARSGSEEPVDAAVSVTASGSGIAVAEATSGPKWVLRSACALGASSQGYAAAGSTAGSSDVEIALFNPEATPAVADLTIDTATGAVAPAAFQGVVVSPSSLVVLDLSRFVPQRKQVDLTVDSLVGRVVIGALSTLLARVVTARLGPAHTYVQTGQSLSVGVGRALTRWIMALAPVGSSGSGTVRLFDPGSRPASATVESEVDGRLATLSLRLSPGTSGTSMASPGAGVLTVRSARGVGLAAEYQYDETLAKGRVSVVSASAVTITPSTWVLPGATTGRGLDESIVVTNASSRAVSVTVDELLPAPASGAGVVAPPQLTTLDLGPMTSRSVPLSSLLAVSSGATSFGLEVRGSGPILVDAELLPTARGSIPALETAIPAG